MNIFFLDKNTELCARYHVDTHTVKMITETAQILSTAHRVLDGTESIGLSPMGRRQKIWRLNDATRESIVYKSTHINHPSTVWARASSENYKWLYSLLVALSEEYTHRYGKIHKVFRTELGAILGEPPTNIMPGCFSEPTPAMPEEFITPSGIESYRNYYSNAKRHLHKWTKREKPDWIKV